MSAMTESELFDQVQAIIQSQIRPKIQLDGGDIELIKIDQMIVHVKLKGACIGCPFSFYTLVGGVQKILQENIPSIKKVVPEED